MGAKRSVLHLALLVGLLLALSPFAPVADAITDQGHPAITRLWAYDDQGRQFFCSAAYLRSPIEGLAVVVSAGHCANVGANIVGRSIRESVFGFVDWRAVMDGRPGLDSRIWDIALGTTPDPRRDGQDFLWLADAWPGEGQDVWIHGFPLGVERVVVGHTARWVNPEYPGSFVVITRPGEIDRGSSGSPVLDGGGRVVGVVWGLERGVQQDRVYVTPVEAIHELYRLLGREP